MSINGKIVQLSSDFVERYLKHELAEKYCYHNQAHTTSIVNAINEISEAMKISDHERYILLTAGWFHDLGYIWQIDGHESVAETRFVISFCSAL